MASERDADAPALRCDFCGVESGSVRRVALDDGYERLRTPHEERYACGACSERKERQRLGLARGGPRRS
jgi:hypothetical protein